MFPASAHTTTSESNGPRKQRAVHDPLGVETRPPPVPPHLTPPCVSAAACPTFANLEAERRPFAISQKKSGGWFYYICTLRVHISNVNTHE